MAVQVEFRDAEFKRLECEPSYTGRYDVAVVKSYRKKMNFIRNIRDERDLYAMKSFHFEKLQGNRAHQRSIRLNDQWRLILEIKQRPDGTVVIVVGIEDYH